MKRLLTLLALSAAAAGAQTPPPAPQQAVPRGQELPVDRVVGVVGTHALVWSEVLEAVNQRRAAGLQVPSDSAGQMEVARKVLQELVDEEILVQKAEIEKIDVSDADLTKTVDAQVK